MEPTIPLLLPDPAEKREPIPEDLFSRTDTIDLGQFIVRKIEARFDGNGKGLEVYIDGQCEYPYNLSGDVGVSRILWYGSWGAVEYVDTNEPHTHFNSEEVVLAIIRSWVDARRARNLKTDWVYLKWIRDCRIREVEWMVERHRQENEYAVWTSVTNNEADPDSLEQDDFYRLLGYIKRLRRLPQMYPNAKDIVWPTLKIGDKTYGGPL